MRVLPCRRVSHYAGRHLSPLSGRWRNPLHGVRRSTVCRRERAFATCHRNHPGAVRLPCRPPGVARQPPGADRSACRPRRIEALGSAAIGGDPRQHYPVMLLRIDAVGRLTVDDPLEARRRTGCRSSDSCPRSHPFEGCPLHASELRTCSNWRNSLLAGSRPAPRQCHSALSNQSGYPNLAGLGDRMTHRRSTGPSTPTHHPRAIPRRSTNLAPARSLGRVLPLASRDRHLGADDPCRGCQAWLEGYCQRGQRQPEIKPGAAQNEEKPSAFDRGLLQIYSGGDLLSQGVSPQVPSALAGLTSVFGMGTGVTPPLWPPETGALSCQGPPTPNGAGAPLSVP